MCVNAASSDTYKFFNTSIYIVPSTMFTQILRRRKKKQNRVMEIITSNNVIRFLSFKLANTYHVNNGEAPLFKRLIPG